MHESGSRTDDGWALYGGLTGETVSALLQREEERRRLARHAREADYHLRRAQAIEDAQPRIALFRALLDKLGITPPGDATVHEMDYADRITCRYKIAVIPQADRPRYDRYGTTDTSPARTLTAVLEDDDQVHIHVTGRPERSASHTPVQTWDAGPVVCEDDLARVLATRGNVRWSPPAPASEPVPEPEPTAAEIARELLDELAQSPINRQGPRGIALATAYATLAAAERHAQADDET